MVPSAQTLGRNGLSNTAWGVCRLKPFTADFEGHCTELLGSAGALNLQASLQEILGRWISFSLIAAGGRPYESTPCVLPCRRASFARDAACLGLADGIHSGDADRCTSSVLILSSSALNARRMINAACRRQIRGLWTGRSSR